MKKLGIIGGLGPAATALLFTRIVEYTCAERDQDHLDITVLNRPWIPDRTAYLLGREGAPSFVQDVRAAACELRAAGCEVIAIPCNTSHARFNDIFAGFDDVRCLHMINEAARFAASRGCQRVGVLATDGTVATGVYAAACEEAGIQAVYPSEADQQEVMRLIYDDVKAHVTPDPARLAGVCERLVARGADGVVLGCTELSTIPVGRYVAGAPIVDALDVLAWCCVRECGGPAFDLPASYNVNSEV